jgi:hypothetical protein
MEANKEKFTIKVMGKRGLNSFVSKNFIDWGVYYPDVGPTSVSFLRNFNKKTIPFPATAYCGKI